ncbi:hypothetical protein ACFLZQ_04610 [Thermodesulfobacteriota bacterium]
MLYNIVVMIISGLIVLVPGTAAVGAVEDWMLVRSEDFSSKQQLSNLETFGDKGWLTARIRNEGKITIKDGFAHFETHDFQDSALIRITESLPENYKIRVKLGKVHFNLSNYEDVDYNAADFKYNRRWVENGFYWLTVTDRLVEDSSGEDWWHRYRKIVIDSDDHSGERLPLYMVYMNPDLDRSTGNWISGQGELLRTWSGDMWHTRLDNWEVAHRFSEEAWYTVELEKTGSHLVMRLFSSEGVALVETSPVSLNLIYGMGKNASEAEYAYIGEPHVDSYEGDAYVDKIELYYPARP